MTPLEAAHARHHAITRGMTVCADCLTSWPCDFQRQREETVRALADADRLAEALRRSVAASRSAVDGCTGSLHTVDMTGSWIAAEDALAAHEAER